MHEISPEEQERHDGLLKRGRNLMDHIINKLNGHDEIFPRPDDEYRRKGDMDETCIALALIEEKMVADQEQPYDPWTKVEDGLPEEPNDEEVEILIHRNTWNYEVWKYIPSILSHLFIAG